MSPGEIQALARLVDRMDYYRLLRVERHAPLGQIRAAYHGARRVFHPDCYLREPSDIQQAVDHIARRITEAWMVLRDSSRRPAYDRGLDEGNLRYTPEAEEQRQAESQARGGRTPNGRKFFAMSKEAEDEGDLGRAIANLQTALTFEAKNPAFLERLEDLKKRRKAEQSDSKPKNPYQIK